MDRAVQTVTALAQESMFAATAPNEFVAPLLRVQVRSYTATLTLNPPINVPHAVSAHAAMVSLGECAAGHTVFTLVSCS